ncbi:hypothetical protein GCM10027614_63540 [Micromonospora vulcania]
MDPGGTEPQRPFRILVHPGLRGTWRYTRTDTERIDTLWSVPGFTETGIWHVEPRGDGSLVTHEFTHRGPLAAVLASAYRGVAELRLDRLAQRAAALRTT